jgi:hypothetical protein
VETGLLRDSDWAPLDGQVCRVTSLTPMGWSKRVPLAAIELESPPLPEPTTGFVGHKLDYQHLTEAFRRKESEPNTEILILWTKKNLKRSAKLLARYMPRMWVMLCPVNAYELITDQTYKPELQGLQRWEAQKPIAEWKPDVMQ